MFVERYCWDVIPEYLRMGEMGYREVPYAGL